MPGVQGAVRARAEAVRGRGGRGERFVAPTATQWARRGAGSRLGASDEFARTALTREAYLKDPAAIVGKLEQHAPVIPGRA